MDTRDFQSVIVAITNFRTFTSSFHWRHPKLYGQSMLTQPLSPDHSQSLSGNGPQLRSPHIEVVDMAKRRDHPRKSTSGEYGDNRAAKRVKLSIPKHNTSSKAFAQQNTQQASQVASGNVVDAAPRALNAKQRKRLRQRQNKAARLALERQQTQQPPRPSRLQSKVSDLRTSKDSSPRPKKVEPALLSRLTTTHLVPRPTKKWVESPLVQARGVGTDNAKSQSVKASTTNDLRHAASSTHTQATGVLRRSSLSSVANSHHQHDTGGGNGLPVQVKGPGGDDRRHSQITHPRLQDTSYRHSIGMAARLGGVGLYSPAALPRDSNAESFKNQPVSRRALAVPVTSVSGAKDIHRAFERFSKYLAGESSEESDEDESEDSDQTNEDEEDDKGGEFAKSRILSIAHSYAAVNPSSQTVDKDAMKQDHQPLIDDSEGSMDEESSDAGSPGTASHIVRAVLHGRVEDILQARPIGPTILANDEEDSSTDDESRSTGSSSQARPVVDDRLHKCDEVTAPDLPTEATSLDDDDIREDDEDDESSASTKGEVVLKEAIFPLAKGASLASNEHIVYESDSGSDSREDSGDNGGTSVSTHGNKTSEDDDVASMTSQKVLWVQPEGQGCAESDDRQLPTEAAPVVRLAPQDISGPDSSEDDDNDSLEEREGLHQHTTILQPSKLDPAEISSRLIPVTTPLTPQHVGAVLESESSDNGNNNGGGGDQRQDHEDAGVRLTNYHIREDESVSEVRQDQTASSTHPSLSTPVWPANVGMKRQLSFLDHQHGGSGSRRGESNEPSSHGRWIPSLLAEDEDLFKTIDEVADGVFSSTRPLPASMQHHSVGSSKEQHHLTRPASDRKMMCIDRFLNTEESKSVDRIDSPLSRVVTSYAIQVPEDFGGAVHGSGQLNRSAQEAGYQRYAPTPLIASSSSLSDLPRTPTPPREMVDRMQTKPLAPSSSVDGDQGDDVRSSDKGHQLSPAKKRKMTGTTSKHFTPEKQVKRTKARMKTESPKKPRASVVLTIDEHDRARTETREAVASSPTSSFGERIPSLFDRGSGDDGVDMPPTVENGAEASPHDSKAVIEEYDAKTLQAIVDAAEGVTPVSRRTRSAAKNSSTAKATRKAKGTTAAKGTPAAEGTPTAGETPTVKGTPSKPKRKSTGKKSEHFLPFHLLDRVDLPTPTKGKRAPAGVSIAPVPSIRSERFGIIQEKLSDQPFWLLIATVFLNKTAGRAAAPTFWIVKDRFPTPEDLAQADQKELHDMIHHLGFQTQRSKRLIKMSEAWIANPPQPARRHRTEHYPVKGDGMQYKPTEIVECDAQDFAGALEIGHIPGCGPYAWDSWRIFCRDILRGVAQGYNGQDAVEPDFEPEWKRVLPKDKELRATLRWMWLREGFIWNPETGDKRLATEDEMEQAVKGEMEVPDAGELKFAKEAAGKVEPAVLAPEARLEDIVAEMSVGDSSSTEEEGENIVVAKRRKRGGQIPGHELGNRQTAERAPGDSLQG